MSKNRNIVIVPYCDAANAVSGANIVNYENRKETYMKNLCIALISAADHNGNDTDVCLVTDTMPEKKYADLITASGAKIIIVKYDMFRFSADYPWSLAYYKLCALYHIVHEAQYENYCIMDTDVMAINEMAPVWDACDNFAILSYSVLEDFYANKYREFLLGIQAFQGLSVNVDRFSGSFIAFSSSHAKVYSETALEVFNEMIEKQYVTPYGDEFIEAVTFKRMSADVTDFKEYTKQFWTDSKHSITGRFSDSLVLIHLPNEKERGMIKLFDSYYSKGKKPSVSKIRTVLSLDYSDFTTKVKFLFRKHK